MVMVKSRVYSSVFCYTEHMSEFDELNPPPRGEMPNPEKLLEMLQEHAYEAGYKFAQLGEKHNQSLTINYGAVHSEQVCVTLVEPQTSNSRGNIVVMWRTATDLDITESWPAIGSAISRPEINFVLLKDKLVSAEKRSQALRSKDPNNPEVHGVRTSEQTNPEELAYVDSLLTQLASQQ
jgi:hypothetical protein